ncbi:MAG: hypothetical protein M3T96_02615, partial [Acidobacteriota bacterium]|nr:hypothetical protein [Acidobacteriota bacterium]
MKNNYVKSAALSLAMLFFINLIFLSSAKAQERRDEKKGGSNLQSKSLEQRNEVTFLRGRYNTAQFKRHNRTYRYSAAFHFQHGKEHDVLQLTPLADHEKVDADFNQKSVDFVYQLKAKTEPTMEMYGPYTARIAWSVYRTIDWTHDHHEQTYDIMADAGIPWDKKKEYTDRAVRYYLEKNPDVARSIAPLDVTMRRAALMMK